jgi:redox-sensing transcriptional repressor
MVYRLCEELEQQGKDRVSSTQIGRALDMAAHTIRKDLNHLGEIGDTGSGYAIGRLKQHLAHALGFEQPHRACIVGLGRLGTAILEHEAFDVNGYEIVAGFDANINRLETLQTCIQVYPAYEISEVVQREKIELAIMTVPRHAAQEVAQTLCAGGIRGIINFAPIVIKPDARDVTVRNINVVNELRILSSILKWNDAEPE